MYDSLQIRSEQEKDIDAIESVIQSAFKDHPFSDQSEYLIVSELRNKNDLSISLVAEIDSEIVGHIAFSKVTVNGSDISWYGLAPVSVHPDYQMQGIGSELIRNGLKAIQKLGANGCVLVGEAGYYNRFGFYQQDKLYYKGVPEEYFLVLPFDDEIPSGVVQYHEGFMMSN